MENMLQIYFLTSVAPLFSSIHMVCFCVQAMFLVYCALEKEPVPMSLPAALVPLSKRKPISVPGAMPLIPSSTSTKDSHQSLPPVGILAAKTPLSQVQFWSELGLKDLFLMLCFEVCLCEVSWYTILISFLSYWFVDKVEEADGKTKLRERIAQNDLLLFLDAFKYKWLDKRII